MPEAPRSEPDLPGDIGQAPSACGVDQRSRVSRARFRGPAGSTGCPGPLGPVSEVPRFRPDVSGDQDQGPWALGVDLLSRPLGSGSKGPRGRSAVVCVSGLCPSARGVHQLSRATRTVPKGSGVEQLPLVTRACVRGPPGSTSGPGHLRPCSRDCGVDHWSQATQAGARGPAVSTKSPGRLGFWSESSLLTSCPGRPGPMPRACGLKQMSRATSARLRLPAGSTSCPGGLRPDPEGPRGRLAVPGFRDLAGGSVVSTSLPGPLRLVPEGPRCPLLSRATRAGAQGPAVSTKSTGRLGFWAEVPLLTSCPRRPGPMPEGTRGRIAVPGEFGQAPTACGVDQLSRVTRARFRGQAGATGCPGQLGPGSESPGS